MAGKVAGGDASNPTDDDAARADSLVLGAINSIRPVAAYELVVEQVKRAIFLGRFVPGDKLPPERDLAAQMLVSRTTIREAMRVLEGEGLIQVKRGATGGLVVKAQSGLRPHEVESYMEAQREMLDAIYEYRIANECMAARLAATRRSKDQLRRMASALKAMGQLCETPELRATMANIARFRALDSEFHLAVAEASGNRLIQQAVEDARTAMFLPIGKVFKRLEDSANEHHEEIFAAISDGDPDRAAEAMRSHIVTTRQSLENLMPQKTAPKRAAPRAGRRGTARSATPAAG
ncbi:FadR/GntR family transcriptional regulator [Albidovulum sp.]|uniref:FadR/GntR family transcriptional regulator n=1 Tax=Albidovulum sp. TaxID=1872424 RepID=UPI0039B8B1B6